MRIGITGCTGFIGSNAVRTLTHAGYQVTSLDRFIRSYDMDNHEGVPEDLDWVFHFAANTSIRQSMDDPFRTYYNNFLSTLAAIKIAHHCKAAFLFMSSYVYGNPRYLPIDEKHPVEPVNPYMGSKIIGEEMCLHLSEWLRIPLVILRGFNIYGDYHIPGRLISDVLEAIYVGKTIIVNDPLPRRDYLYIKDFCSLLIKIIQGKEVNSGIYNVGYGKSYSNLEVAEIASKIAGNRSTITVQSAPRPNDVPDCSVNVSLAKNTFSWTPCYSLEQGLRELITSKK
jgi:UDP-glucose 4-epimerase